MTDALQALTNDPTISAVALAAVGAVCGLWLAAAWWTYSDAARRTSTELPRLLAAGWVLVSSPVLLPLSLGAYLLVRPQQTAAEQRAERLFTAMAGGRDDRCPTCDRLTDPAWHRCPGCEAWLASACSSCGRWSTVDLDVCPWCAHAKATASVAREVASGPRPARSASSSAPPGAVRRSGAPIVARRPAAPSAPTGLDVEPDAAPDPEFAATLLAVEAADVESPRSWSRPGPENRGTRGRRADGADRTAGSESVEVGS